MLPVSQEFKLALRALIVFPAFGILAAILSAFYFILRKNITEFTPDIVWDIVVFASLLGATFGFVLGLPILWLTRNQSVVLIGLTTVTGTVIGSVGFVELSFLLLPDGPRLYVLPILGFVAGALVLHAISRGHSSISRSRLDLDQGP